MTASHLTPAAALATALLCGCATVQPAPTGPETLVVVVPSRHDGHVGAVVVNEGDQREVLNTAYAAARTDSHSQVHRSTMTADQVNALFADASAALPHRAVTYTLYFMLAKPELTPESSAMLDQVLGEVASRQAAEIVVTGHTDRIGTDKRNDALSLSRAQMVRDLVIKRGASPDIVHAVGMGKREPIVPTADGVAEPKNRRVEILVR